MALPYAVSSRPPSAAADEPVRLFAFGLCVANAALLASMLVQGAWLIDPAGFGVPTDFVNVWAAGRLVLEGHPAAAYDWALHKQVEDVAIGQAFAGYYAWYYPPFFLALAAPLALMPYATASAAWSLVTFPAYGAALARILGARAGLLLACAFPAAVANVVVGQNGFLTAGLLGGALATIPRRPMLAGCLIGLLTYKPQFGLLLPLVLIAGKQWRVFATAAAVAIALAGGSLLAFGPEPWQGFLHNLQMANDTVLSHGDADLAKLQSLFGLLRALGASATVAWTMQAGLGLGTAAALWVTWRRRLPFAVQAAAAAVGTLLATPYVYAYDLVVLAVAVAFLIRAGAADRALPYEWTGLGAASLLILSFGFVKAPVGFLAVAIVAALVVRRALVSSPEPPLPPAPAPATPPPAPPA